MISIAKNAQDINSFLEIDWLHFVEAALFWASIHVQCMSFRQSVRAIERNDMLPVSLDFFSCVLHLGDVSYV